MQYRLGELFCGPGGIAWGATHADIGNSDRLENCPAGKRKD